MLELLLNAVWLAVVAGALTVVPRRSRTATFAVACILVLLFPVISVSDDLVLDRDTLEESVAIIASVLMLMTGLIALARVEHFVIAPALILFATPSDPRSPPRA